MCSPTRRQSSSGGRGGWGSAACAASCSRSRASGARRSISDWATQSGMLGAGAPGPGGGGGGGGIGERKPWNGFHSRPSKRHLPSVERASFHLLPSQNQLPSADHSGGEELIERALY